MKRFLLLLLAFVIVLAGLLLVVKYQFRNTTEPMQDDQNFSAETADFTYVNESGEALTVQYESSLNNMYLTYHSSTTAHSFDAIELVASTSASGAKYENTDLGLVFWEKSGDIMLYENDELIFQSVPQAVPLSDEDAIRKLSANAWKWHETIMSSGDIVTPNRPDAFTLKFSLDKTMSGSTDCNGFSGSYSVSGGWLSFGSMMSTLMFCEGSQETEYVTALAQTAGFSFDKEGNLVLGLGDGQGSMTFVAQQ